MTLLQTVGICFCFAFVAFHSFPTSVEQNLGCYVRIERSVFMDQPTLQWTKPPELEFPVLPFGHDTPCSHSIYLVRRLASLGRPCLAHSGEPLPCSNRTITLALFSRGDIMHCPRVTPK